MERFEERNCVVIENEGQKIFGMFHRPLNMPSNKFPVVLMCHGFAGNKSGRYRIYVSLAQELAKAGIASLRIDFRGSGDSEGDFSEMTIETEVSDVLKALEFLNSHPQVDNSRIGLLGNSFGGAIAVLSAKRYEKIKSLVLLASIFNSQQWRQKWEKLHSKDSEVNIVEEMMRAYDGNVPGKGFYKSFFNLDVEPHLPSLQSVPLLLIHSEADDRVSITEAENYVRCRKNAMAETQFIKLNKCGHDFSHFDERSVAISKSVDWFSKTL
jgi:dipeptidyl aminopeptidase/acylaminoacyl peptidase